MRTPPATAMIALCAACALCPAPARAELTPADVWARMQAAYEATGMTVAATRSTQGDTLRLSDVQILLAPDDTQAALAVILPGLTLSPRAGGDVALRVDSPIALRALLPDEDGATISLRADMRLSAPGMIISGSPQDMTFRYAIPRITLTLTELAESGRVIEGVTGGLTLTAATGQARLAQTDAGDHLSKTTRASQVELRLRADSAEEDAVLEVEGVYSGLEIGYALDRAPQQPGQAAQDPMRFGGAAHMALRSGTFALRGSDPDGPIGINYSIGPSSQRLTLAEGVARYRTQAQGMSLWMTAPDLPIPLALQIEELSSDIQVAVPQPGVTARDTAALRLRGLAPDDSLWQMLDPSGLLPRMPLDMSLGFALRSTGPDTLAGPAIPRMPLSDTPLLDGTLPDDLPVQIDALELTDLSLSALGARLTGSGMMRFDHGAAPADAESLGPLPMPSGTVSFTLQGANALLMALVQAGLLEDEQAFGARMMLGTMAVPGNGPDELRSEVQITPEGEVIVNGLRLR